MELIGQTPECYQVLQSDVMYVAPEEIFYAFISFSFQEHKTKMNLNHRTFIIEIQSHQCLKPKSCYLQIKIIYLT